MSSTISNQAKVKHNVMKKIITVVSLTFILSLDSMTQIKNPTSFIDPTGTYVLIDEIATDDTSKTVEYKNEVRVRLLDSSTVIVGFFFCQGPPAYNFGCFLDTLLYSKNTTVYTCPEFDSSCILTLTFSKDKVISKEQTEDYNWGCGFGHGVVANGIFEKTSNSAPDNFEWWIKEE
jgi:hypothetical protein